MTEENKSSTNIFVEEIVPFVKEKYKKEIRENDKDIISPYVADLYFPEDKLVVVYKDLLYNSIGVHDTIDELNAFRNALLKMDLRKKDKNILKTCREKELNLFIIFENELINPITRDIWKSMIHNKLNLNTEKYYARDCIIKEVDSSIAKPFFINNHIQGNVQSTVKLGLFHKKTNELLSILSMGRPRYNKNFGWEIIRFASKKYTNVVGAGNKLFKHFLEKYAKNENILTYANTRWSTNGAFYQKLGFTVKEDAQENYFYFKEDEKELKPRIAYQKHKLSKVLEKFDENLTEHENVLGYNLIPIEGEEGKFKSAHRQIYDSGNLVLHYIGEKNNGSKPN